MVNNKIIGISCEGWKIHTMLENTMLENTYHSGKYIPCWKIHTMLDNTYHAGQYIPCWTMHTSIYQFQESEQSCICG
jgi:hypothetical protein